MSKSAKKKLKKPKHALVLSRHTLLTFGHDPEGMPSDDSEDSDYAPTDDEQPSTSKKKRKQDVKIQRSTPLVKKSEQRQNSLSNNTPASSDWSHRVPNELLHKVFMFAVCDVTAVPLLCRVSQVCQKWNAVASDACLWKHIDLSYMAGFLNARDETLHLLIGRNALKYVQVLNLCGWKKLTSSGVEVIVTHCKELRSLNLSSCTRISAPGMALVASKCKKLTSINLSYVKTDATSNMSIKNLLHERGRELKALYLEGNKSVGVPSLVAVQSCCCNLEVLEISHTSITTLHVERLQAGCPKLVELRLSQLSLSPSLVAPNDMINSAGFPDLELLSLASITGGDGTNDLLLERLLKTSTKLRQLDLRGCKKITHRVFTNLATTALEQLFLSRCKVSWRDTMRTIQERWKDSLRELDVSWVQNLNDTALISLVHSPSQNTVLAVLNLAGSGVSSVGIRNILDCCPNLSQLNLLSCRGVPRGYKKVHDVQSIKKMRTQLQTSPDVVDLDALQ